MTSNSKIVITGSSGYLAGRVIQHIQSFSELDIIALSRKKLPDIFEQFPSVHQIIGEMSDEETYGKIPSIDQLIHLAAPNEMVCADAPLDSITTHLKNTWKLIEQAHKKGLKQMVYMSTIHVYGSPLSGKITEETIPQPNHPYALMHHTAEETVNYLSKKLGFKLIIFRLSNAFGAPLHPFTDRWKLLVNDLCKEAVQKGSITLNSSGEQKRNFIPISEVCLAIDKSVLENTISPGIYNLCGSETSPVIEMATKIKTIAELFLNTKLKFSKTEKKETTLDYSLSNEKLRATGFIFNNVWDEEIINTLELIMKNYK